MASFVDRVVLHVKGGDGGNGCASIHREKFVPLGGPDGGNGGRGGDVILEVDSSVTTLLDFHFHPHQKAGSGRIGQGGNRHGAFGSEVVLRVPNGTVVLDEDGNQLADLIGQGTRYVVARGGQGGLGNAALANTRRKAPGFALLGEPGEERDVVLELKSVADVALVGFPSAGKSSLVSVVSAAKPKIADYPFTTLAPNLGVVETDGEVFTVADVPGLIPGASQGKGLGLEFLRHVERCSVIVHVIDGATLEPDRDPLSDLRVIEAELEAYRDGIAGLNERPRLVVINKIDVPDARDLAAIVEPDFAAMGYRVFPLSTATHEGLVPFLHALAQLVRADRHAHPADEAPRIVLRPKPVGGAAFAIRTVGDGFEVVGEKPERWVRQTDFSNAEAVGYLADRLAKLGVEDQLVKSGAQPGAGVTIGSVTFDWQPSTFGDEVVESFGPRGSDDRLLSGARPTRAQRNARTAADREFVDDYDEDELAPEELEIDPAGLEADRPRRSRKGRS